MRQALPASVSARGNPEHRKALKHSQLKCEEKLQDEKGIHNPRYSPHGEFWLLKFTKCPPEKSAISLEIDERKFTNRLQGELSMIDRTYKKRKLGTLKEAQSALVQMCGGPAAAAEHCRVTTTTLFNYTDDSGANLQKNMPVDVVRDLESNSEYPVLTEHLADQAGYIMYKVDFSDKKSQLHIDIVETGEEIAKLFRDWANFISDDGVIDKSEARKLLKNNQNLVRVLMRMRTDLISQIDDPDVPEGTP